jgi:hypothetical protein
VDYLHEFRPPLFKVPMYPRQPDSYPHNIYVNDPRPTLQAGRLIHYRFGVDDAFKIVGIPLSGQEFIDFDFGAVYHHTFMRGRWGNIVDYEQLPLRFETYSPIDQQRIQAKMAAIQQAQQPS